MTLSRTSLDVGEVDNYSLIRLVTIEHTYCFPDARHSSGHQGNEDEQKNSCSQDV